MDVIDLPPAMHALMAAVAASCAIANPEEMGLADAGAYGAACWLWGAAGNSPIEEVARELDLTEFKLLYNADDRAWLDGWIDPIFNDAWSTLTMAYRVRPFQIKNWNGKKENQ